MRVIQVAIADDDPRFREALAHVVEADERLSLVGVAASGHEIAGLVARSGADVVLLDVRMAGGGPQGASMLASLGRPGRTPPAIVALSAQSGVATVVAMLRAGAVGYLVKGHVGADLPELILRVAAGEVVLAVSSATEALRRLTRTA